MAKDYCAAFESDPHKWTPELVSKWRHHYCNTWLSIEYSAVCIGNEEII
jgi:hypothetical protein